MIDVNKITSTLAKLPDQQLQQYAQMHKSDPYIMALAMSESNRRKEMRAAGQGAQGMQEQPKVVDQMVAGMAPQQLPEEMGIGQLPAGEMNFAGGGIVAFADGGDVERYQSGGNIFAQMDQQKAAQLAQLNSQLAMIEPQLRAAAASGDQRAIQTYAQQAQSIRGQINAVREAAGNRIGLIESPSAPPAAPPARVAPAAPTGQFNRMAGTEQFGLPTAPVAVPTTAQRQDIAARDRDSLSEQQAAAVVAAAQPATTPRAPAAAPAPRTDAPKREAKPGAGLGAAAAAIDPNKQFDVSAMMSAELAKQRAVPDPLEADRAALAADRKALAESNVAGIEAIQKNFDNIFSGRKARMDTREGEIGKMKDQTLGLALLNAGATMMQTRGNLGTAIGAGIGVGSKQYVEGMGRIESAKEKLSAARDRLEEIETQRGELSARELFKANQEVKQVGISVKDDMIKARMALNNETYTKAEKAVTAQLNANLKMYEQQQANLRTDKTVAGMNARAGDPANKQLELQIKVQNLLQNNPEYKAAAQRAQLSGPMGDTARAAMKNIERDTYAKFAPELLKVQSAPASPTGARGGVQFLGYEE